jgi:general bacterial porin, GBP family
LEVTAFTEKRRNQIIKTQQNHLETNILNVKLIVAVTLLSVPLLCAAESSVTLYGIIDTGLAYNSNQGGKHAWKAQASNLSGNRWGFKGVEDLGGGLQAVFQLENGFDLNGGAATQGGRLFGRQAFVGLSSKQYGALTLGRQYDSVLDYVGILSSAALWGTIVGSHVANIDEMSAGFRINNSVKYTSIDYSGFSFGALYGASNQAGAFANNQAWSLGARYGKGPFVAALAYFRLNNPAAPGTAGAVGASGDSAGTDYTGASGLAALGGSGTIRRHQSLAAGTSYALGDATFTFIYTHTLFSATIDSAKADNFELGGTYRFTPAFQLGAAYIFTSAKDDTGKKPKYHQANLGLDYFLSKRTDLYLVGIYQRAAGDAKVAALYTQPASSSKSQLEMIAGIRQRF